MKLAHFKNGNTNTLPYFNNIFDSLFNDVIPTKGVFEKLPSVNVSENEQAYVIDIAAPGLKKEDFHINLKKDVLTISVESKKEESVTEKSYTRKEFDYSYFSRSFNLPEHADGEKISAEYKDGILAITVGKKDEAKLLHKEITVM